MSDKRRAAEKALADVQLRFVGDTPAFVATIRAALAEQDAEVKRLKKRLAYAEANEQADCEGTQQCQGCHDCRIDYAKDVRLEIDRLTRERDEAWVQLNMTKGEAGNDYRQCDKEGT
jgi:hypothetical protein